MKILALFFSMFWTFSMTAQSQILPPPDSAHATSGDTTKAGAVFASPRLQARVDSMAASMHDSVSAGDSMRARFIPRMGQITQEVDSTSSFYRRQFVLSDFKYPGEIFARTPGFFLHELGEAGKPHELLIREVDQRGIALLIDGRPMNDPLTGSFNLFDVPLEYTEYLEHLSGGSAVAAGSTAGEALNVVTGQYVAPRPITKVRYVQEPFETILADGMFAQNIARGANLTFGFLRDNSQGRYRNAVTDSWNIRSRLRYDFSWRFNVSASYYYTKAVNGLNGGVDLLQSRSVFDENFAAVRDSSTWETRERHDVTVAAVGQFLADSISISKALAYASSLSRKFERGGDVPGLDETRSFYRGLRFQQEINVQHLRVTLGAQYERRHLDASRTLPQTEEDRSGVFGTAEIRVLKSLHPSLHGRYETVAHDNALSAGFDLAIVLGDWLECSGGIASFVRFPTLQELFLTDSIVFRGPAVRRETHTVTNLDVATRWTGPVNLSVSLFNRRVKDPVVRKSAQTQSGTDGVQIFNANSMYVQGVTAVARLRLGAFEGESGATWMSTQLSDSAITPQPQLTVYSQLCFHDRLFKDALEIRTGFRSRYLSNQQGRTYLAQADLFVENTSVGLGRTTTLDFFASLLVGSAYISLSWDNLLNADYLVTPIYPMPGRHFKLGVNWTFTD